MSFGKDECHIVDLLYGKILSIPFHLGNIHLTLLTESRFASAGGAQKKISFTPNPIRITATAAMIT
jgi:hypothetical protein